MKTIKYLILKLKAFALSESPYLLPWWGTILYFSVCSYCMALALFILISAYKL